MVVLFFEFLRGEVSTVEADNFEDGVVLIGASAAGNDPTWGNGMAVTLRDVRILRDALLDNDDWTVAADLYARDHDVFFQNIRRVTTWLADLLYEIGRDAERRRDHAFAKMQEDRSRNPDSIGFGPEVPSDEVARRRMFGED